MRRTSNLALKEVVSRTTSARSRPVAPKTARHRPPPRPVTKAQTGGARVIRCLEREGVEYVFGLSGGAAMPIFDALVDSKIKLILVRHEQGATHMADGYARATGKPGVVLVTSGPGATNTVTGLLTALMDSVPDDRAHRPDHLADAGQGRLPGGRRHRHHLPGGEALLPGEERRTTSRASCARRSTSRRTGRPGPVLIDLPKDVTSGAVHGAVRR